LHTVAFSWRHSLPDQWAIASARRLIATALRELKALERLDVQKKNNESVTHD
jgi:hypothetical protein